MSEKFEQITLLATAILSILVALADFLGFLESISWLSQRIPTLLLLLLAIIAGYLALERRSKLDKIDNRIATLEERYSQINAFFNAIREKDHFAEIALIYGLRTYGRLLSERKVVVERSHVLDFWRDCIAVAKRWLAVTYVRQEDAWDMGWGDAIAQGIQQERILAGGTIKRVFMVDDENEAKLLMRIMKAQQSIGIDVRWLISSEFLQNQIVAEHVKELGSLDFAVVNDSWVTRYYVDKERRHTHADAIKDDKIVDKANFVFTEAFSKGKLP
jgi:hypothetical protein